MKLHLKKNQREKHIGVSNRLWVWEITAWLELTDEERVILRKNPDVGEIVMIEYDCRGFDKSPTVNDFADPKLKDDGGFLFITYSDEDTVIFENRLNARIRELRSCLLALKKLYADINMEKT